jgi:hypothetical protein
MVGLGTIKEAGGGVSAFGLHHGFLDERKLNREPGPLLTCCAAKYSPAPMSATPCSKADSNVSVFDLDVVGPELDGEVELVLAGAHVVLPPVPGATQHAAFEASFAERSLEMEAVALECIEGAVAVRQRDLLVADLERANGPGRDVVHTCDADEAVLHGADPNKGLRSHVRARYPPPVATILLCGVDVYFRGKLEALLPGHHFVTTDSADWPDLVIADISRVDPMDVADSYPEIPILGFGGHADTAGLRRAHEAGFDQVLVKNALQERAAQVVEELTA